MHSFWSLLCLKLLCIKTGTDTQQWSISSASTLKPLNGTERGIYQSTIGRKLLTTRTIPLARPNASCRYRSWTAVQQHCCLLSSHTDKGHRCTSGGRELLQVMKPDTICIREPGISQMGRTENLNCPAMPGNLITDMPSPRAACFVAHSLEAVTRHPFAPEQFKVQELRSKSPAINSTSWWDYALTACVTF